VLSNPSSQIVLGSEDKVLTILKDQLCRAGTRFDEKSILNDVHGPGRVPGVIEAVHHERIKTPWSTERMKDRLGLRQSGLSFTATPTLRNMLETLFDVLEGNSITVGITGTSLHDYSVAVFVFAAANSPS
jgi:hypothetical protein